AVDACLDIGDCVGTVLITSPDVFRRGVVTRNWNRGVLMAPSIRIAEVPWIRIGRWWIAQRWVEPLVRRAIVRGVCQVWITRIMWSIEILTEEYVRIRTA